MEEKLKRRIIIGTLISVLITLGFVFFKSLSISTHSVMRYPIEFFNNFASVSAESGASKAILSSLISPFLFIIPFIPITLAFSILIFYGVYFGEDRKLGLFSSLIPSVIGIVILGPSVTTLLFSLSLIICGILCTSLTVMYLDELKKWKKYRIGERTIGKLFLIINLFLFFALMINVVLQIDSYNSFYKEETKNLVSSLVPELGTGNMTTEGFDLLPPEQQEAIRQEYSNITESQKEFVDSKVQEMIESEKISSLINFFIFLMPFTVFALLELLRILVLSTLGGLISTISLSKIEKL